MLSNYKNIVEHVNAEYLGDDGIIVDLKPETIQDEDNPHYFTVIYFLLCDLLGTPDHELRKKYFQYVLGCEVIDFGIKVPGLFHRFPYGQPGHWQYKHVGSIRKSSQEELMAIAAFNSVLAISIYDYGKRNKWCWDNRCPNEANLRAFMGRFLEFIPYLKSRTDNKLNLFNKICYSFVAWNVTRADPDWTNGRLKIWVTSLRMRSGNHGWLVRKAIEFYLRHMTKTYGDLGTFMGKYFGKEHPFAVWTTGKPF